MISLSDPQLGDDEKRALADVIDGGWLTMGERVAEFERRFAALHDADAAVAVGSCTAGLHLTLAALGIGPGDEVLVPSLSFVATVNAVLYVGARPVFVDIERADRPHLSLADAEAKLGARTRAVIIMHYGGYLMDLAAWHSFAERHRLRLIEDAAHAPAVGEVGRHSDFAVFSFFTNKNMTTAEGGMVIAPDPELRQQLTRLRGHGMSQSTLQRHRGHAYSYDVTALGFNYRLDELRAALGLAQLPRLRGWNERRRRLSVYYRRALARRLPAVSVPFDAEHPGAAHLFTVLLPPGTRRDRLMRALRERGVQSSIHYPPVHRFSYHSERCPTPPLPHTDAYCASTLTLPLHPGLQENDLDRVIGALEEALYQVDVQTN